MYVLEPVLLHFYWYINRSIWTADIYNERLVRSLYQSIKLMEHSRVHDRLHISASAVVNLMQ